MTEHDIGKMITCTIDSMPVPWEKLWTVFRKILQLTQREMRITSYKKKKIVKWKQWGKKNEMQ